MMYDVKVEKEGSPEGRGAQRWARLGGCGRLGGELLGIPLKQHQLAPADARRLWRAAARGRCPGAEHKVST